MGIGFGLKEERSRLSFNQADMAAADEMNKTT